MNRPVDMVDAIYCETSIGEYKGNPLIEALPPFLDTSQIRKGLSGKVEINPNEVNFDNHTRIHLISQVMDGFFQPLSRHIELEGKLSVLLRQGYVGRNLANGQLNTHIQNGYERVMKGDLDVFRFDHGISKANSLSFIGCSGTGKTCSMDRILATYPQLIYHKEYNFTQIVFLKIDCPHDGSLKSLCNNFFRKIDEVMATNYVRRYVEKRHSVETLIALMAHVANTHAIGLLIIDEIQHLNIKNSGGAERMLNFFVTLVNEISVPVVMVGTPKASPLFDTDFRSARRAVGYGSLFWEPLKNTSDESQNEWISFTDKLWKFQWLRKAPPEIPDDLREVWFNCSQGILDIVVKLFVLSQVRAVITGLERITPLLMERVYNEDFKPIHRMIEALKSDDAEKVARYSDLTVPDMDKKLLELGSLLQTGKNSIDMHGIYSGNEQAIRLHNLLLELDYDPNLIESLVTRAFNEHPHLSLRDLMPILLKWHGNVGSKKPNTSTKKIPMLKKTEWHTLDSQDLRFLFSQTKNGKAFYEALFRNNLIIEAERWVDAFA